MKKDVTHLLNRLGTGDASAHDARFDRIYEELRALARSVARGDAGRTLAPTALVHEAYLRLVKIEEPSFENRRQFYALAAQVMRRVLASYARARNTKKRGGDEEVLAIDTQTPLPDGTETAVDLLDLGLALEELAEVDGELVAIAEQRYFGGLSPQEIADSMDIPLRTIQRRLQVANSWLRNRLG